MSLIRTDYVSEWRISAHPQSVLAAAQKHHTINSGMRVRVQNISYTVLTEVLYIALFLLLIFMTLSSPEVCMTI